MGRSDCKADTKLVRARASMDFFEDVAFPALVNEKQHWNGWAVPYFSFSTAKKVMRLSNKLNQARRKEHPDWEFLTVKYDKKRDVFQIFNSAYPDEPCEDGAVVIDGKKLYPLGGCDWCWYCE